MAIDAIREQARARRLREALGWAFALAAFCLLGFVVVSLRPQSRPPTEHVAWHPDDRVAAAPAPLQVPAAPSPASPPVAFDVDDELDDLLEALKRVRARRGLSTLRWSAPLENAAWNQAEWMAAANDWAHETPDNPAGATPAERVANASYDGALVGEVIAWGQDTPQAAVTWWLGSPPHRRALLDPAAVEAGMAVVDDPHTSGKAWVVVFGRP